MHISLFLEKCDTIKMNRVSNDAIRLRLFPFSLKDKAKSWLLNSSANSFTTWEALSETFLCKLFLPRKMAKLRNDITSFFQVESDSLYEAWERFKELKGSVHIMDTGLVVGSNLLQWFATTHEDLNRCGRRRYYHGQTYQ